MIFTAGTVGTALDAFASCFFLDLDFPFAAFALSGSFKIDCECACGCSLELLSAWPVLEAGEWLDTGGLQPATRDEATPC